MLKYFTNVHQGNASQSLAINPRFVVTVFESILTDENTNTVTEVTAIYVASNIVYHVTDSYLDVVARLNERD
jgi:hypothetical protein